MRLIHLLYSEHSVIVAPTARRDAEGSVVTQVYIQTPGKKIIRGQLQVDVTVTNRRSAIFHRRPAHAAISQKKITESRFVSRNVPPRHSSLPL